MKPCRVMSVQSLRMHALKAFEPDSANLHSTVTRQELNGLSCYTDAGLEG